MDSLLGFLGILYRGGRLLIGSRIEPSLSKGKLLLVASDAVSGESARLKKKAAGRGIEIIELENSKAELGSALARDEVSLALVLDTGAAARIISKGEKR